MSGVISTLFCPLAWRAASISDAWMRAGQTGESNDPAGSRRQGDAEKNQLAAAVILGLTEGQLRRNHRRMEQSGLDGLIDRRHPPRKKRISAATVKELCRLRRELYREFSVRHFYEHATEKHGLSVSSSKARSALQEAGLAPKLEGRGVYRRKRERRPRRGMMLHLDGPTRGWIQGLSHQDLMAMLDDATSEIVNARCFEKEGTRHARRQQECAHAARSIPGHSHHRLAVAVSGRSGSSKAGCLTRRFPGLAFMVIGAPRGNVPGLDDAEAGGWRACSRAWPRGTA